MKSKFILVIASFIAVITLATSAHATVTWAERYRTIISGYTADHTYVCISGKGCYAYHGGTSGGSVLQQTSGVDSYNKSICLATRPASCMVSYLTEGVCHQEANRMLYPSRKLVTLANGYALFAKFFGTYGKNAAKWDSCKRACGV